MIGDVRAYAIRVGLYEEVVQCMDGWGYYTRMIWIK